MRNKRIKKALLFLVVVICLTLTNILFLCAATEYVPVVIGGKTISHYNTGGTVSMPATYVVDSAEMRGAWVQTVWNGDMPKQKGDTEKAINEYKARFLEVLDTLEKYNINTIFFQIRPCNDAFYVSEYNDWSEFLVGIGKDPGWDPLEWMIEETHKRSMYFMGWMNAFRVTTDKCFPNDLAINHSDQELIEAKQRALSNLTAKNFARQHPECTLMGDYDSKLILNPGDPLVHEHIVRSLEEIATNYDIDGYHFDDYFYPDARPADLDSQKYNRAFAGGTVYNELLTGENIMNDLPTYKDYQENPDKYDLPSGLELGEFRRQSVNNMMRKIREMVDRVNETYGKHVEYGTKPAAVWQSNYDYCHDSRTVVGGSNTHCGAYSSNYDLFADTKYWVEAGYVDWVAPQVYYDFSNEVVPYADIVSWWAGVVKKVNEKRALEGKKPVKMYVAHGIYKYHDSDTEYNDANEMVYQVRYNKLFPEIKGDAVYEYCDLEVFKNSVQKQGIGVNLYVLWSTNPVLPLPKAEFDTDTLTIPSLQIKETGDANKYRVVIPKDHNVSMYAVYRVDKGATLDLSDTTKRIYIVKTYKFDSAVEFTLLIDDKYDYYVEPVSQNYYPSKNTFKLDKSMVAANVPPSEVEIKVNDGKSEQLYNKDLNIHIDYAQDPDNTELKYDISISLDGKDGQFKYKLDEINYTENGIEGLFLAFGVEIDELVIKVEVSDGIDKTITYSKPIKLVKKITEPETPIDEPDPIIEPIEEPDQPAKKKGCKSGLYVIPFVSACALGLILLKKRH